MAGINLTVHLEYEEVVERLKAEGWVIPVRCCECIFRNDGGKWIWNEEIVPGNPHGSFRCSKCGHLSPFHTEYCPNCGRPMRGGSK